MVTHRRASIDGIGNTRRCAVLCPRGERARAGPESAAATLGLDEREASTVLAGAEHFAVDHLEVWAA